MIIDVALKQGTFTYKVPLKFKDNIKVGSLVKVPFQSKQVTGMVLNIYHTCHSDPERSEGEKSYPLKEIGEVLSEEPIISQQLIELTKQASDYYQATPGAFFDLMLPSLSGTLYPAPAVQPARGGSAFGGESVSTPTLPAVISESLKNKEFKSVLIFGAKRQELYLKLIEATLSYGRGIILLTPQILLANLLFSVLHNKFGNIATLLHSALKNDVRAQEWQKIKQGNAKIVVGTMNAVFAPLNRPGLIIVDEEQDTSYKSGRYPRYSAKTVASMRAKLESALYVEGSATPSIEAFSKTTTGESSILKLTSSTPSHSQVQVVDMRKEASPIFSRRLKNELEKYIKQNKRILLFLNKKGFSGFILCEDCGYVPRCPKCGIALTYYKTELSPQVLPALKCRYCNYTTPAPGYCPQCKGTNLSRKGTGIAQVEKEFIKLFSKNVNILRVDKDTASPDYINHILKAFGANEFQVLLGTQIIIKPYLLPEIGLVGVISADTGLNIPDFRAGEHTFSLLSQLLGKSESAIVQTHNPAHIIFQYISKQDIIEFYKTEEISRKELNYPPYSHLVSVTLEGKKEAQLEDKANKLKDEFEKRKLNFIGPSLLRTPRKTEYQFLIKTQNPADLHLLEIAPSSTIIDVDPL